MIREIQTGLFVRTITTSTGFSYLELTAGEGYCFYDKLDQYYDEEGNLIPENEVTPQQRLYSVIMYTPMKTDEELNAQFVSVVRQDWMEVLGNGNDHEVA